MAKPNSKRGEGGRKESEWVCEPVLSHVIITPLQSYHCCRKCQKKKTQKLEEPEEEEEEVVVERREGGEKVLFTTYPAGRVGAQCPPILLQRPWLLRCCRSKLSLKSFLQEEQQG